MLKKPVGVSLVSCCEATSIFPKFCKQVEGELFTHTHKHMNDWNWQRRRGFVFNPPKHQQLQQNKEALFQCVFAHSLEAYTLTHLHTHTHSDTHTEGVLGYDFARLHHCFLHSYGKWTAANAICSDADGSRLWQFVKGFESFVKRTTARSLPHTRMPSSHGVVKQIIKQTVPQPKTASLENPKHKQRRETFSSAACQLLSLRLNNLSQYGPPSIKV